MGFSEWFFEPFEDFLGNKKEQLRKQQQEHKNLIKEQYGKLSAEEIVLNNIERVDKLDLLVEVHGYSFEESVELIDIALREAKKAKLRNIKRKISQKAGEQYNDIPIHDRQPIPGLVKMYVWKRDGGKCIKCGNSENLEFDHIIPISKGGSNTERNIQLLCESCNRTKSSNI